MPYVRRAFVDIEVQALSFAQTFPDDPEFTNQWGLHNTGQAVNGSAGTAGVDINAPEGWTDFPNAADVIVAVFDTGIDYTHIDLNDNIWSNSGETPANNLDDDMNGYIDDVYGWDFGNEDNDPGSNGAASHGTMVAGIIGAEGNNNQGVSGVAWTVQMMPVKFMADSGRFSPTGFAEALNYAIANGASISNHSWGFTRQILITAGLSSTNAQYFIDEICNTIALTGPADHLAVAAAGNSTATNNDTDSANAFYPATCTHDNIVSVTGLSPTDTRYGNYGPTTVDLAAPGLSIRTTQAGNTYTYLSGTSAAAPFASGAGRALSSGRLDPHRSPDQEPAFGSTARHKYGWRNSFRWCSLPLRATDPSGDLELL